MSLIALVLLQFLLGSLQILKYPDRSISLAEWRKVPQVALPVRPLQKEKKPKCCLLAKLPIPDLLLQIAGRAHKAMSAPKEI